MKQSDLELKMAANEVVKALNTECLIGIGGLLIIGIILLFTHKYIALVLLFFSVFLLMWVLKNIFEAKGRMQVYKMKRINGL